MVKLDANEGGRLTGSESHCHQPAPKPAPVSVLVSMVPSVMRKIPGNLLSQPLLNSRDELPRIGFDRRDSGHVSGKAGGLDERSREGNCDGQTHSSA